jgi:hypothetical protein
MPSFRKPDEYVEPVAEPLSPNRAALVELNEARAKSAAEVAELQERLRRLDALKAAVQPLEAEFQALDSAEAAALAEWSANPDAPTPTPDLAARSDVMARITGARQSIASSERATASVEHVLGNAHARGNALQHQVPAAIAAILLDEARAILPQVVEATLALAKVQGRYRALREFLLTRAEVAPDVAQKNGFFHDLERLDKDARDAANIGPLLSFNAGDEWRNLAAELGDVSTVVAHSQTIDPITAASRAAGSFRTHSDGAWS